MLDSLFCGLFNFYVGMLCTICFVVCLTITLRFLHYLFCNLLKYNVGMLRTIYFLVSVTVTLACCALFVFWFF